MQKFDKFDQEYHRLVPPTGCSSTLRGEILRAAGKIRYRWYNDGDRVGAHYGHTTCDPAARFLISKLSGDSKFGFTKTLNNLVNGNYGLSGDRYDKLVNRIVGRIEKYMDSIPESSNTEDMLKA